jgi:hypothetical protein
MKCLLIKTRDKRSFFTDEKNYSQLSEFSKTFNAEISIVVAENAKLMDLSELTRAFCDSSYKTDISEYKEVGKNLQLNTRKRTDILKIAEKVKKYITRQFITYKPVSLYDLKNKFQNLTSAALCNHVRRVKQELELQGYKFTKSSAGTYKAIKDA